MAEQRTTSPGWIEAPLLVNIVRAFWVFNLAIMLILFALSVEPRLAQLSVGCDPPNCPEGALTQRQADDLLAAGVPLAAFAWTLFLGEVGTHVVYGAMGVMIFWYRSKNFVSLLVSLALVSMGFFIPGTLFADLESLPAFFQSASAFLFSVNSAVSIVVLMVLYPDGKLRPKWMWFPLALAGAAILISIGLYGITPGNPWVSGAYMLVVILGVYSQTIKYREFRHTTRHQQYRWALLGVGSFILLLLVNLPIFLLKAQILALMDNTIPFIYLQLGTLPLFWVLPITMAISILRHNLWNIDFVLNRAAVYGAITLLIVAVFAGSLFAISSLSTEFTNRTLVAIIVTAVVFAFIFQPLQRRLQRWVDRRLYNIQIDYLRTPTPLHRFAAGKPETRFGAYSELELIGRGGMAEVYRAYPDGSNEPVAIKILPEDLAQDLDYRKRFEREVQVMQALAHEHIVKVVAAGEEHRLPYIVMEFVQGRDLSEHLGRVGKLDMEQTKEILEGVCSALDFAHDQGMVHRDIKPSNIMLDQQQRKIRPVLMDFGIAKILGRSMMTNSGFLGTLDYISPEQIQGLEDVDRRSDIYSLAVMTYQMLTGKLPFPNNNPGALLMAHLSQPAPDIRQVDPELPVAVAVAVATALSKEPRERFGSAAGFMEALGI